MDQSTSPKQQLSERLKQANNILVTVSRNPSVDQLAAAIGLTLVLNHLGKHATAVFSGNVPSTIEFLKPDETLEKNTDSLRDFIIALDKSKADKLRYKVEDKVVKIFITPYRTSISQDDLQFSQGDFNVDVVVGLGVREQDELDEAITAHGRILHDATVATINTETKGDLGSIAWVDNRASSLCELVVNLTDVLDKEALDNQVATALLTGIVAATDRFSNDRTSPATMSASAELMAAGANQQLVATKLSTGIAPAAPAAPPPDSPGESPALKEPGELDIAHADAGAPEPTHQVAIDEHGNLSHNVVAPADEPAAPNPGTGPANVPPVPDRLVPPSQTDERRRLDDEPDKPVAPINSSLLPHSGEPGDLPTEALTLPAMDEPMLRHDRIEPPQPVAPPVPPPTDDETLTEIEESVHSPHLEKEDTAAPNVDDARSAVEAALNASSQPLPPVHDLNALPLGPDLHGEATDNRLPPEPPQPANPGFNEPVPGNTPADATLDMPVPGSPLGPPAGLPPAFQPPTSDERTDPNAPPPVPPPMLPPL